MSEKTGQDESSQGISTQGTLLGAVIDLSGSMHTSMRNRDRDQYSRIESVSKAFRRVMDDAQIFVKDVPVDKQAHLRLFIQGFGFLSEDMHEWKSSIGDVLSVLSSLDEQIAYYQPLQPELETMWLDEVAQMLEEGKVQGDAKEELRLFVEKELREQAIQAEQQRSAARFQRWCASVCQSIDVYNASIRLRVAQYKGFALLLLPFIIGFLWLLRGLTSVLAYANRLFENWVQRTLADFRDNANKYAMQQAEKVVTVTKKALSYHSAKISKVIEQDMIEFIDKESFKLIRLYNARSTVKIRKQAFDRKGLEGMYENVSRQISDIMSPHASHAWKRSLFLLKRAAKALKIQPNWELLREKTIRCAHQVVWETITPEVKEQAKALAKERFTRAVLTTIVQATKDNESTFSLQEVSKLLERREEINIVMNELPIFGPSPMGLALNQTFLRLWREAHQPQNKGLHPAVVLISDGLPTDTEYVDALALAEQIKQVGIPIICCFVTNKNVGRPWLLRRKPGWFWSKAAHLMFSMSSTVDEWPEFGERLKESRFVVKKQGKLFIQVNHSEYLQNMIEAILLPVERERRPMQEDVIKISSRSS